MARARKAVIDLEAGTSEHYRDASLYDFEYRHRRADVTYYRALARERAAASVLELGCGTGRVLLPLARDGRRVVGIDRSPSMLARARRRIEALPAASRGRAALACADFLALPLRGEFPLVIAPFNTLQHLYDRRDVVALFAAVRERLAPGGCFAFDVLNPDLDWLTQDPERRYARTVFRHPATGRRVVYTTNQVYDPVHQVALMRIFYEEIEGPQRGREQVVQLTHRCFFPEELLTLVEAGGLRLLRRSGGFQGQPFTATSESQILECAAA